MIVVSVKELDLFKCFLAGVVAGQVWMHPKKQVESCCSWEEDREEKSGFKVIVMYATISALTSTSDHFWLRPAEGVKEPRLTSLLRSDHQQLGETVTRFLFGPDVLVPFVLTRILQKEEEKKNTEINCLFLLCFLEDSGKCVKIRGK